MKTTICSFLLLVAAGSMPTFSQTLVFHLTGGAKSTVALPATFTVTPTGDKLVIDGGGTVVELAKDDVMCVTYRDKKGDVNGDQTVDVADIATIISIMAGGQEPAVETITVTTGSATDITQNSAVVKGTIENVGSPANVGIIYGTSSSLSIDSDKKAITTSMGSFSITLFELSAGTTYYYRAFAEIDGQYYYGDIKTFMTLHKLCPDDNHPHLIDLSLPSGTKWACCNVGASKPEEYGGYYAWGETETKSWYGWDTYQYGYVTGVSGNYDYSHLVNIGSDISGTQYDAATANWGAPWRMPSLAKLVEIVNNCSFVSTAHNGVNGWMCIGKNGHSIFIPASGSHYGDPYGLIGVGEYGGFWSSSLTTVDYDGSYGSWSSSLISRHSAGAWVFNPIVLSELIWGAMRNMGKSVRAVQQ